MILTKRFSIIILLCALSLLFSAGAGTDKTLRVVSFTARAADVKMYWKDDKGKIFGSIRSLKEHLQKNNNTLRFAMNAGMYKEDGAPLGLYVENGKVLAALNTANDHGNFYLKPNGVFYITSNNSAAITKTQGLSALTKIKYATQSGPMLVIDGTIHPGFHKGSTNVQIRNGVGILPDGRIIFAMSTEKVNLYDFATYFKQQGCRNALYLDGFVSRTYLPEKRWAQEDGNFGVIIGICNR